MGSSLFFLKHLAIALLLGGLMGLEREKHHALESDHEFGGIRTLMLASTLGFLVEYFFPAHGPVFLLFSAAFLLLVGASHVLSSWIHKSAGATTEMAGIFAYLIGILVGKGDLFSGSVITLVVILTLYFKEALHSFAHRVDKNELYDALKFLAATLVIWPLLPDQAIDPWGVINPYEIWLIMILISGISFASYIAMRIWGARKGVGLSGLLGGLISSTAVTFSLSHLSRKIKATNPFVLGILLACTAMFGRVLITLSAFGPWLLPSLQRVFGTMILTGLILCVIIYFQARKEKKSQQATPILKSPFQIESALKFTGLFALMLLLSHWAANEFGERGVYAAAFFSGIFDVDAMTLSIAKLSQAGDLSNSAAALGIMIVVMTNTASKGILALMLAAPRVGKRLFLSLGVIVLTGVGSFYLNL